MRLDASLRHQVQDLPPPRAEIIGDQAPMATPPHRLGAHHRAASAARKLHQVPAREFEFRARHVIGISAERSDTPGAVARIAMRRATAAQFRHRPVLDPCFLQRWRHHDRRILRIAPRPGETAHVHQALDLRLMQQCKEVAPLAGGMPDRPKRARVSVHGVVPGCLHPACLHSAWRHPAASTMKPP